MYDPSDTKTIQSDTYTYLPHKTNSQCICVCIVCIEVLSCMYPVHIVAVLYVLYVFAAAKSVRRAICTRYIQYIQIHTDIHQIYF